MYGYMRSVDGGIVGGLDGRSVVRVHEVGGFWREVKVVRVWHVSADLFPRPF